MLASMGVAAKAAFACLANREVAICFFTGNTKGRIPTHD